MLMPKRVKHRKVHRGRRRGVAKGGTEVNFGEYGIQALEEAWITSRQIEAARVAMTRYIKRGGKVWIRLFPDKPITLKPAEPVQNAAFWSPGEAGVGVSLTGGEAFLAATDWSVAGRALPMTMARTYRSSSLGYGPLGSAGWSGWRCTGWRPGASTTSWPNTGRRPSTIARRILSKSSSKQSRTASTSSSTA